MPLDWRVLAFTIGVAPALTVSSLSPNEALKEHGRGASGERRAGLRQALVVLQVALSLMLVVTASLFIRMVLARVGVLVVLGVAIGTGASFWASRFVASFLYGFKASDPATFVGAAVVLGLVAAAAGWFPARRASRTDPTSVLRDI